MNTLSQMDTRQLSEIASIVSAVIAVLTFLFGSGVINRDKNDKPSYRKNNIAIVISVIAAIISIVCLMIMLSINTENTDPTKHTLSTVNLSASIPSETVPSVSFPQHGIHDYDYIQDNCSWRDAQDKAVEMGGHLVCFETKSEYEHVLKELEEQKPYLYYMRIGARRDKNSTEYYWVDQFDRLFDKCINSNSSWCKDIWKKGEPSITWTGETEAFCVISYDWDLREWILNDIPNEVQESLNQDMIGFIVEYE